MKLLLHRKQRSAINDSKPVFVLTARADISGDERAAIAKYKLGDTELYASHEIKRGSGLLRVAQQGLYPALKKVAVWI